MLRYPVLVEKIFTPAQCEEIIARGVTYPVISDITPEEAEAQPQGKRRAFSNPVDYEPLIKKMMPVAARTNAEHYRFKIDAMETPHFCEYREGECSPLHNDFASDANTNRKLTLIVFLSDPNAFTGGQLHLYPFLKRDIQQQGNLIIFPSYIMHQVEPVIRGVRYSLVSWGIGPPFT